MDYAPVKANVDEGDLAAPVEFLNDPSFSETTPSIPVETLNDPSRSEPSPSPETQSPRHVVLLLFLSYCGVYFCRADVSVVSTTLIENSYLNVNEVSFGLLVSAGTFTYACGKLVSGATPITRPTLRIKVCMAMTSLATLAFSVSPTYSFLLSSWLASRLVQSQIWTNFAVVVNETFSASKRGGAIAVLSQSFLVGDAIAKVVLGAASSTLSWRGVCALGGCVLLTLTCLVSVLLKSVKVELHASSSGNSRRSLPAKLRALSKMPSFWFMCLANGGTCFVREVFRDWVPLLLADVCSVSPSAAAMLGTVPSLSGAAAVLTIGFLSDKQKHRGPLLVLFLAISIICMLFLATIAKEEPQPLYLVIALIAGSSLLSGPYSVLTACTLDCCSSPSNADLVPLFQGLQDGSGYMFAAASGVLVGESLEDGGWSSALAKINVFAVIAMGACAGYWREERRREGNAGREEMEGMELVPTKEVIYSF